MRKVARLSFLVLSLIASFSIAQPSVKNKGSAGTKGWTVNQPFQRDVFIENKGQFSADERNAVGSKIVYYSHKGSMYLYFTPDGLIFRYDSVYKPAKLSNSPTKESLAGTDEDGDKDGLKDYRIRHLFTKMKWVGSNPNATIEVQNETPDYFTFPNYDDKSGKSGIMAHGFTKLIYKNMYPGIDVEFYYPNTKQSLAGTGGIEYNLIIHPGADPSLVKIQYSGSTLALNDKDMNIQTSWGKVTDHAPSAQDENSNSVPVSFALNGNTESFITGTYDKTKTLTIDPWITATTLGGVNLAYDIGYDYAGNVYVYGGGISNYYELQQYNSAGTLVWTFVNNAFTYLYVTGYFYGDLTVDHNTGTSYMCEGFAPPSNHVVKVNSNGLQAALLSTGNIDEMWRIGYDYCNNQLVIASGGISSAYACLLDTNCTTLQPKNILNSTSVWDQSLLAFDNVGECYIGTCQMIFGNGFNNDLCKMPLPSLTPTTWMVPDLHDFIEITNISYYPVLSGYVVGNGFNGLAATPSFVASYDGGKMRTWNAATGANIGTATVSATSYAWGGLDIDCQGNIYCGNNQSVSIYDSNLNALGNIPLSNTVYDLLVAPNGNIYACGNGFVQCVTGASKLVTVTYTPAGCACNGTATAHPCGKGPFQYLWSNGATTQTISALCANPYTVTVTSGTCLKEMDTAIADLGSGGGGFAATVTTVNPNCTSSGSATALPTTGNPPYTYSWSNGTTTSSDTGLGQGNYYVLITDSTGCKDSLIFTIINATTLPVVAVSPTIDTICNGGNVALTASGAISYNWLPSAGLSCTSCPNPTATPTVTTTYTVTGDSNGCFASATTTITIYAPPTITLTASPDTVCLGHSSNLQASGAVTYAWAPSTGLSCANCPNPICTPTATTLYTVIGTDAHGCTNASTITVYVSTPSSLSVSGGSSICPGESITLIASGSSNTFNWQPGNFSGATISVTPSVTTTYIVSQNTGCGIATATVTISVNPEPVPAFTGGPPGCPPLCIQFRDMSTITSGKITAWTWKFGNGDSASARNPIYCYPKPGIYTVDETVTSDSGCSATLKILDLITVYSKPVAAFTLSPQPATVLQPTIQFTNESSDAYGIAYYRWTFGNGDTTSTLKNPSYTYSDTGTYCATLVVMNIHGCTDTAVNCLVIDPIYCLYIPDAFSPNGDGKNDVFMAKGNDIKTFEMYIFDRWGMQLFYSADINNGWNGTVNGSGVICQEDSYIYLIKVTDHKNNEHTYTGQLSLIK